MKQIEQHVQDSNIKLVRTVKKYPALYDVNSNEYALKQHTQKSWEAVAAVSGLTGKLV